MLQVASADLETASLVQIYFIMCNKWCYLHSEIQRTLCRLQSTFCNCFITNKALTKARNKQYQIGPNTWITEHKAEKVTISSVSRQYTRFTILLFICVCCFQRLVLGGKQQKRSSLCDSKKITRKTMGILLVLSTLKN